MFLRFLKRMNEPYAYGIVTQKNASIILNHIYICSVIWIVIYWLKLQWYYVGISCQKYPSYQVDHMITIFNLSLVSWSVKHGGTQEWDSKDLYLLFMRPKYTYVAYVRLKIIFLKILFFLKTWESSKNKKEAHLKITFVSTLEFWF